MKRKTMITMMLTVIIVISNILAYPAMGLTQDTASTLKLNIDSDIEKIDFQCSAGQGRPSIIDDNYLKRNFDYTVIADNEIDYIIHLLNTMQFVYDGKVINGGDLSVVNIVLTNKEGTTTEIGFLEGRLVKDEKQFAVDSNQYYRLLDFIYALKTGQIVLEGEVTFKPSAWATEDVDQAIDDGLVPEANQINYTGKINRLEVCQLVENLLTQQGHAAVSTEPNPFQDTSDQSVVTLYRLNILNGKTENQFYPFDIITREEWAKILANTYQEINGDTALNPSRTTYKDQEEISDWAVDSVNSMTSLGVFKGNENGEFEPQSGIKKEEVIVTLLRIHDLME